MAAEEHAVEGAQEHAPQYATGGEYIQHHLGFLVFGKKEDGHLGLCPQRGRGQGYGLLVFECRHHGHLRGTWPDFSGLIQNSQQKSHVRCSLAACKMPSK